MFRLVTRVPSYLLCSLLLLSSAVSANAQSVFINEIHYDNVGTDSGEAIEVAGPAGTNLNGWSLVLYNGNPTQRTAYSTLTLSGTIPNQVNGFGTLSFAAVGLQNGGSASSEPDGIVLFNGTSVVQFLCYEGTFIASGGVANGLACSNIGVADDSPVPAVGTSLRLSGTGTLYTDFAWNGAAAATFGAVNTGQTFVGAPAATVTISPTVGATGTSVPVTITGTDTHFAQGTTAVTVSGGGVSVGAITVNSATSLSTTFTIDGGAALGSRTVSVTTNAEAPNTTFSVIELTTKIHDVQGSGSSSPLTGQTLTTEGVVVAALPGLTGFYVQEEDADADLDPATSEGIFVYDPNGLFAGAVGTKVRVTGAVSEFTTTAGNIAGTGNSRLTELTATSVATVGTTPLPIVTNVVLPVTQPSDLERYEGMLVNVSAFDGPLVVTETFKLGRYGQVGLSGNARLDQYTQVSAPSVSGYANYLTNLQDNYIILDDGSTAQNPDPAIHARGGQPLSALNTLRGGDTIASITGVLDERFEGYRVQTTTPADFQPTNARTNAAPAVGGTLKVASGNLLNFFNGNGLDANNDGFVDGGFPTSRGADTAVEFKRQIDKTVQALLGVNADVFGYNEMENDGYGATSAVQQLVNALNAATAPGTFAFVTPPASALISGKFGSDEITVGFIYKTATARIARGGNGPAALTTGIFDQVTTRVQRPALAVTFERVAAGTPTGELVTAVISHFKSKGSSAGLPGDADQGDGQGLSNATRTQAAQELAAWMATRPTGTKDADYLILGDLNSYRLEDPITTLTNSGYFSLFGPESYSYQFNGQWGSLDHALVNASLNPQVTGAAKWHINADEPVVLDYNTEFKSAGQVSSFYNVDPFRTSDHDPVLVGLSLVSTLCGDFDDDGDVDGADQTAIRSKFGANGQGANSKFDFDRNNTINLNDYRLWLTCQRTYAAQ